MLTMPQPDPHRLALEGTGAPPRSNYTRWCENNFSCQRAVIRIKTYLIKKSRGKQKSACGIRMAFGDWEGLENDSRSKQGESKQIRKEPAVVKA